MSSKIIPRAKIPALLRSLRKQPLRIVFTNGCFDLLHAGHVRYLEEAGRQGDCLIVGLNSDRSVRKIKGPSRPLISGRQRAEVLAALTCVSWVVLFSEPDPYRLIELIHPDVLVKGADWTEEQIIGADLVRSYGGKVCRVDLVPQISTSEIIRRIVERYGRSAAKKGEKQG
ncbi:MAG: D-glycero-beta-D-manno-heptose 1-phosphate adenylyltransferase [Desulfobacterota bacterium]|jgi:D-beta-D-heptose 7-phosphate kinase/D-beta-D-heptose 1-phosphate adenosyltransferase|nr:D-glycero-beta-D-manno-heptose 1-phosphate adenylyltransferase [Thermodesulfobacteriota bacterium]